MAPAETTTLPQKDLPSQQILPQRPKSPPQVTTRIKPAPGVTAAAAKTSSGPKKSPFDEQLLERVKKRRRNQAAALEDSKIEQILVSVKHGPTSQMVSRGNWHAYFLDLIETLITKAQDGSTPLRFRRSAFETMQELFSRIDEAFEAHVQREKEKEDQREKEKEDQELRRFQPPEVNKETEGVTDEAYDKDMEVSAGDTEDSDDDTVEIVEPVVVAATELRKTPPLHGAATATNGVRQAASVGAENTNIDPPLKVYRKILSGQQQLPPTGRGVARNIPAWMARNEMNGNAGVMQPSRTTTEESIKRKPDAAALDGEPSKKRVAIDSTQPDEPSTGREDSQPKVSSAPRVSWGRPRKAAVSTTALHARPVTQWNQSVAPDASGNSSLRPPSSSQSNAVDTAANGSVDTDKTAQPASSAPAADSEAPRATSNTTRRPISSWGAPKAPVNSTTINARPTSSWGDKPASVAADDASEATRPRANSATINARPTSSWGDKPTSVTTDDASEATRSTANTTRNGRPISSWGAPKAPVNGATINARPTSSWGDNADSVHVSGTESSRRNSLHLGSSERSSSRGSSREGGGNEREQSPRHTRNIFGGLSSGSLPDHTDPYSKRSSFRDSSSVRRSSNSFDDERSQRSVSHDSRSSSWDRAGRSSSQDNPDRYRRSTSQDYAKGRRATDHSPAYNEEPNQGASYGEQRSNSIPRDQAREEENARLVNPSSHSNAMVINNRTPRMVERSSADNMSQLREEDGVGSKDGMFSSPRNPELDDLRSIGKKQFHDILLKSLDDVPQHLQSCIQAIKRDDSIARNLPQERGKFLNFMDCQKQSTYLHRAPEFWDWFTTKCSDKLLSLKGSAITSCNGSLVNGRNIAPDEPSKAVEVAKFSPIDAVKVANVLRENYDNVKHSVGRHDTLFLEEDTGNPFACYEKKHFPSGRKQVNVGFSQPQLSFEMFQKTARRWKNWEPFWSLCWVANVALTSKTSIAHYAATTAARMDVWLNDTQWPTKTKALLAKIEDSEWGVSQPDKNLLDGQMRLLLVALPVNPDLKKRADTHLWPKGTFVQVTSQKKSKPIRIDLQRRQQAHDPKEWKGLCRVMDMTEKISDPRKPFQMDIMCFDDSPFVFLLGLFQRKTPDTIFAHLSSNILSRKEATKKALTYARPVEVLDDIDDDCAAKDSSKNADMGKFIIELRDLFTKQVLGTPARGKHCRHFRCFDLQTFLAANTCVSGQRWRCVCEKFVSVEDIEICGLTNDLVKEFGLTATKAYRDKVEFRSDGTYILLDERKKRRSGKQNCSKLDPDSSKTTGGTVTKQVEIVEIL